MISIGYGAIISRKDITKLDEIEAITLINTNELIHLTNDIFFLGTDFTNFINDRLQGQHYTSMPQKPALSKRVNKILNTLQFYPEWIFFNQS